ncbi:MAG: asparaginase [Cytophagales bacterium]
MSKNELISILKFNISKGTVLVIYTGGTFGMVKDKHTQTLVPYNLSNMVQYFPQLVDLEINIDLVSLCEIVDSSNFHPRNWVELVEIIEQYYQHYDGFIVIHGTDTMAYTASAISFLIENLGKPIIFTGAQLPVSMIRSDARDNLISAMEIAVSKKNGIPVLNEVAIYFNHILIRGNRAKKVESSHFDAFESPNYPILAETGIEIDFQEEYLLAPKNLAPIFNKKINENVVVLKLYPGITPKILETILISSDVEAVVLESFGSGNAPTHDWFLEIMERALQKGVFVYNVSQCMKGTVMPERYETSKKLFDMGVIPAYNMTTEAAITKLMCTLGKYYSNQQLIKTVLTSDMSGEVSF